MRKNNKETIIRTADSSSLAKHVSISKRLNEELFGRESLKGVKGVACAAALLGTWAGEEVQGGRSGGARQTI